MVHRKFKNDKNSRKRFLLTTLENRSPAAEQFRTLRTNMQFMQIDRKLKTLVVTSPLPGEGKSTIAANLSIVLAQQESKVLLIDTDLRKPSVHYTFEISNNIGFTNVVTNQAGIKNAVKRTFNPNLSVLTSGPLPPNPSELLASNRMKRFIEEAKKQYDYIVFDAPPVNAVTDGLILSSMVDGTMLVIRNGKTEIEQAKKAVGSIQKVEGNLLGAVLNDCPVKDTPYSYYYEEG
ncbi:CpsD/CapB family tyrosine-protein kinase [Alkalicoccus halolimnae]|uniref:non-specific protein-tyrosine kinase n=1 Tax=Alkalicoccus halolimnae TaxID=1667239 RepID=A0A5C7FDE8_9BACI|nr:CpsD/CapB family tyrosine-protein kinase [Alkalicoccus halolimnae]TXF87508.1 CpsD/CapB family tyrosine-protein kinase [Alkalicoccus halolimnae]